MKLDGEEMRREENGQRRDMRVEVGCRIRKEDGGGTEKRG